MAERTLRVAVAEGAEPVGGRLEARAPVMGVDDGTVDADASAATYAKELGDTVFDLCLLGMGPDGHVASIFPDHPSFERDTSFKVIGVTDSPKPPPERISLTIPVINQSAEVWLIVSGAEKADAAARAIDGDENLPAGAVHGRLRTVWFLDEDAAADRG